MNAPTKATDPASYQDLLEELNQIGPMSTGTALAEQQRKIVAIQIKATARNTQALQTFDRTTRIFSFILIILTVILIIVAFMQFVFDIQTSDAPLIQKILPFIGIIICVGGVIWKAPSELSSILEP